MHPTGGLRGRVRPGPDGSKHGSSSEAPQAKARDAGLSCKLLAAHGAGSVQRQAMLRSSRNIVLEEEKSF